MENEMENKPPPLPTYVDDDEAHSMKCVRSGSRNDNIIGNQERKSSTQQKFSLVKAFNCHYCLFFELKLLLSTLSRNKF